jgi:quercetin dioxygenase-like cupin family protein
MKVATAFFGLIVIGGSAVLHAANAAEVNPDAVKIIRPDDFEWRDPVESPTNSVSLHGDRNVEGEYYVYINKFAPGNFSMPHSHENDRFITVLKGTWWVGTGTDYDPENNTVPVPAGSFVTHYAGEVHYDGAKDEEVWVLITGVGPSAGIPAVPPN